MHKSRSLMIISHDVKMFFLSICSLKAYKLIENVATNRYRKCYWGTLGSDTEVSKNCIFNALRLPVAVFPSFVEAILIIFGEWE